MRISIYLLLLSGLFLMPENLYAQVTFTQIPGLAFFESQGYLNGVSWIDVDNDNYLDVCVTGSGGTFPNFTNISAVFLNNGNETFTNTGLLNSSQKNAMRHGWADYNNDGNLDLYIGATWNSNGINELWTNNGGTSLTLTPGTGATPNVAQPYEGTVSWADYNNDGWADLFVPRWNDLKNKLYRNNGNSTFSEVTTGAIVNDLAWTSGGFWGDYDNDRDQDLFVVNYQIGASAPGNNHLFRNNGDGTFTKNSSAGQVVTIQQNGRSANWVDVNNDGFLDLFVCNQFGQDLLHLNKGDGTFSTSFIGGTNHTSWSSNWGDYDNDGDQDLITIGFWSTDSRFWENDGLGNLTDVTNEHPNIFPTETNGSNSNSIVWVDYNRDGWLDLHIAQPDLSPDHFYENEKTSCRSWLEIQCIGVESNRAAIGTTLRAKSQRNGMPLWQMRQVSAQTAATGTNPMLQHFGFDDAAIVDSLVVEWPSGKTCVFTQVAVNQILEIREDCTIEVTQVAPPLPGTTQNDIICLPMEGTIQYSPSSPPGGSWTASCGDCIDIAGVFDLQGLPAGEYLLRYQQGDICSGTADTFLINLVAPPSLILSNDTTIFTGQEVQLNVSGAANYIWQPAGNLSCANCSDPVFTADTTTLFVVTGTAATNCKATDSLLITVLPALKFDLPNAFTPNGDGSNDVFLPVFKGEVFEQFHLKIYSRWGKLVFESSSPNQGWNGTIDGASLPSDVYIFVMDYRFTDGRSGQESGDITLLR
jgi:gliding motility-associated-like protein